MSDHETHSLIRITRRPADGDAEILRAYPAFKLGAEVGVRYFAGRLLPLVERLILADHAHRDWVLTSPAVVGRTPAAANLLCRALFASCRRDPAILPRGACTLVDLAHSDESPGLTDWKDPAKPLDYAQLGLEARVQERERLLRRLAPREAFRGRPVLFVNDICVTGAQQRAMQQYFDRAGAACVRWLYVIEVAPEIGMAHPTIEAEINDIPFEELLRTVASEPIQWTGKCVQKLMHLDVEELRRVLEALGDERRRRLLELSAWNGYDTRVEFRDRMELLRSSAANVGDGD